MIIICKNSDWNIKNHDNIILNNDLVFSSCLEPLHIKNKIFDGNGKTIFLENIDNFKGLFTLDCGEIKNLRVEVINSTLLEGCGWIVGNNCNGKVSFCISNGPISENSGGICGGNFFGSVSYCYSFGVIDGNGGGIVGSGSINEKKLKIKYCYSSGNINGTSSGGIVGSTCGFNSKLVIDQCFSLGNINGQSSGGICGSYISSYNGKTKISNCYSVGNIVGDNSGGIIGSHSSYSEGLINIKNSYSSGIILGKHCGSILGSNSALKNGIVNIDYCFGTGNLAELIGGTINIQTNISKINFDTNNYSEQIWNNISSYPKLIIFENNPWEEYKKYNDLPTLIIPTLPDESIKQDWYGYLSYLNPRLIAVICLVTFFSVKE